MIHIIIQYPVRTWAKVSVVFQPALDKDDRVLFLWFKFYLRGMKRPFAQTACSSTKRNFYQMYLWNSDLLSTLSLALLERRAASVAWHSYRESSDSWALEISRLYWPMSRERSTRYLGQAAGDTQQVFSQTDGKKPSNRTFAFLINGNSWRFCEIIVSIKGGTLISVLERQK